MAKAFLLLQDGTRFEGTAVGYRGTGGGEICFNTGMTGYQEIYTDPSYCGQIVVTTASHIGNYGTLEQEQESSKPYISGIVVNEFSKDFSRQRASASLQEYLEKHKIAGIAGVDTRALVRRLRNKGAMNALISSTLGPEELKAALDKVPPMEGLELSSTVSVQEAYLTGDEKAPIRVAALDLGMKRSILKNLEKRGCLVKVFPAKTSFEEMARFEPHGFFVSNGPGDPAAMGYAVDAMRQMIDSGKPVFGICLGHQLLALACGLSTYKMHHGHRGLNHPVKNLLTGLGEMTSQNHGFAVSDAGLKEHPEAEVTHEHLNDRTIMGIRLKNKNVFSVQYHPEASPGPHDSVYLFDQFTAMMNPSA